MTRDAGGRPDGVGAMRLLAAALRRHWLRTLVWVLAACLVVWFYGGELRLGSWQPLDTDRDRLLACLVLAAIWPVSVALHALRERRTNRTMIDAITARGTARDDMSAHEVDQIRARLQEALTQLRTVVGNRRGYVYQLPWYIMIGPPGSGKTTALLNSGLRFPLTATLGKDPLRGFGGTRNCEWWFTDDAILLDTAGRYTTQDSDPELDRREWAAFLGLLKTHRPLQPVNGVIVAMSLEDLVARDPSDRLANSQSIRTRLHELTQAFGDRFPIYVLLTKADLISGFVPFFDRLGKAEREQVWGVTFPLDDGEPDSLPAASRFGGEFDALVAQLNGMLLQRLQDEPDIDRRGAIQGFPLQVAMLREPVNEVLTEIFAGSRHERRSLLRGVYFASGTQSGVPIDRLMGAMAAAFGVEPPRLAGFSGARRSYFLTRLLDAVVFPEAAIVSAAPRARARLRRLPAAVLAASAAAVIGLIAAWSLAYGANRELIAATNAHVARYETAAAGIPTSGVADTDFLRILPALDLIREQPPQLDAARRRAWLAAGLDQGAKLASQFGAAYGRALDGFLLPRILVLAQTAIRSTTDDPEAAAAALRVYLGLGRQGPFDPAATREWVEARWAELYPGPEHAGQRAALAGHLQAVLRRPLPDVALDSKLVAEARDRMRQQPLAMRLYAQIRDGRAARDLAEWTVADHAGPNAGRAFARASKQPLSRGVPGFYTRDGERAVLLPALPGAIAAVQGQLRARSETGDAAGDDAARGALRAEIMSIYRADLAGRWQALLGDLGLPDVTPDNVAETLDALTGPADGLRSLIGAVARDTDLSDPADAATVGADAAAIPDPLAPIRDVSRSAAGQPSRLDTAVRSLEALRQQLVQVRPDAVNQDGVNDAAAKVLREAERLPPPLDGWLRSLAAAAQRANGIAPARRIAQAWAATGQRLCQRAVHDRYPFAQGAEAEVSIAEFTKLFAPGGVMGAFLDGTLRAHLDTSRHPWTWQARDGESVGGQFIAQFERADAIRQAFFPTGRRAAFRYAVTPVALDAGAERVSLSLQGTTIGYAHGPAKPVTASWPGSSAEARVGIEPSPFFAGKATAGPWAAFRLFDGAVVAPRARGGFEVTFLQGVHSAKFEVRPDAADPFARDLRQFRCPGE